MKIGFFTDGYLPQVNGVSTTVNELAKELRKRRHTVYIIAPQMPGYHDDDLNVIRLRSVPFSKETNVRIAVQIPERNLISILKLDFDIVHGHAGGPISLLGMQVAKLRGVPYLVTYHTLWNRYTHYFLNGKIISPKMIEGISKVFGNMCDCLIAPTARVKKELISYGIKKTIHVVPNGIDIKKFSENSSSDLRKKLGLTKSTKVVLFVGRLGKEKSIDFLIRSFEKTVKRYSDAVLLIVGEGSEKKALKHLVEKHGLGKKVLFLGAVEHGKISPVYKTADVFVFASKTETQGMVLIEAMAGGLPIIAVEDNAYKDVVIDGYNGFLVENNHEIFSNALLSILTNDEERRQMSVNAQAFAKKFSAEKTAESLEKIYYSLIAKNDKHRVIKFTKRFYNKLNTLINT